MQITVADLCVGFSSDFFNCRKQYGFDLVGNAAFQSLFFFFKGFHQVSKGDVQLPALRFFLSQEFLQRRVFGLIPNHKTKYC